MEIGDIVRTTAFNDHFNNSETKGYISYKAPKGKMFVLMLLGMEPGENGTEHLDPEKILNEMGWTFTEEKPEGK